MAQPGYDAATGLNTGNLGFKSQQATNYYQDPNLWFQVGNPGGQGYLDVYKDYTPDNNHYLYDAFKRDPTKIAYGQSEAWQPSTASQSFNGGTYNVGSNNLPVGMNPQAQQPQTPYDPTLSPTYKPWSATAAGPTSTQAAPNANPFQGFMFGNNGSSGMMAGTFANNTPGQPAAFYQNQPASLNQNNPALGKFTTWNPLGLSNGPQPINPGLQALQQSRSY